MKHDKDFEPFLKLFMKEMETLEGAVTLNMTKGFCDRIGLDFNELLSAMREKIRQHDVR